MSAKLVESLTTTPKMAALFCDHSVLTAMLAFEVGLARAEANVGVIPASAAKAIEGAARVDLYDAGEIATASLRSATAAIPFVKALKDKVRAANPDAAGYVHWGATSQDVSDTAIILVLKQARDQIRADLVRIENALHELSDRHEHTVMLARTLLQAALPTTFGLKVGGWFGAIRRDHARLDQALDEALVLQLGGAVGTLASLGDKGIAVAQALARELSLPYPDAPWHTHRDRLATLMCAFGVTTASLGKIARDITLMMQNQVAEVAEPKAQGRGGSSAMPHKQNPVGCTLALAAAYRVPGLVSTFLSSMVQEHERAAGGWQQEWSTISGIVQATGLAVDSMAEVSEGLSVDAERMRANLDATHGAIFAERATMLLAKKIGHDRARDVTEQASSESSSTGRNLIEVLADLPEVKQALDAETLKELQLPEAYLGVAEQFRRNLIGTQQPRVTKREGRKS